MTEVSLERRRGGGNDRRKEREEGEERRGGRGGRGEERGEGTRRVREMYLLYLKEERAHYIACFKNVSSEFAQANTSVCLPAGGEGGGKWGGGGG